MSAKGRARSRDSELKQESHPKLSAESDHGERLIFINDLQPHRSKHKKSRRRLQDSDEYQLRDTLNLGELIKLRTNAPSVQSCTDLLRQNQSGGAFANNPQTLAVGV